QLFILRFLHQRWTSRSRSVSIAVTTSIAIVHATGVRSTARRRCGCRRVVQGAEVFRDVSTRTEQSLLFTSPQRDSNRATRLETERLDDAHGFQCYCTAGGVVSGAGAGMP